MPNKWEAFYAPVIGPEAAVKLVRRCQEGPPGMARV